MKKLLALIALIALTAPAATFASVDCDGTVNGYGSATASSDWTFAGDFTLGYWYQFDVFAADNVLFSASAVGATATYQHDPYDAAGTKHFYAPFTGGTTVDAITGTPVTSWHSVIWERSGTTLTLYVDNSSVGTETTSTTVPAPDTKFYLCADRTGATNVDGRIARYVIYKTTAWSSGDRTSFHTSFGCTIPASPSVSWQFASGALNTDSSGNGHTLTAAGTGAGWTYSSTEPGVCTSAFNFGSWFPF